MTISPFRRGRTYWVRVPRIGGVATQRSLGTEDRESAIDMCAFLRLLKKRREAWLLHELAAGRIAIGDAYNAYLSDRLQPFITDARDGIADPLLAPFIAQWIGELARRKRPQLKERMKYERQVRTLVGAQGGITRLSQLTKPRVRAWLAGLSVGQPNRYRAAMSSFCNFLVLEEKLALNPVIGIPASKEHEPRRRHLSPEAALALAKALPAPFSAVHALMIATGIEIGVALELRRRDIELAPATGMLANVFARGTKREHRQRTCFVYDRWREVWKVVEIHLATLPNDPAGKLFQGMNYKAARGALQAACDAQGIADYTSHDHRHTWAVQAIRDGLSIQAVSQELGHRDAVMTLRVYGVFRASAADFKTMPALSQQIPQQAAP